MDLKRIFKLICDEWERTLMTVVMLSLLIFLAVVAYNMLTEDEGSSQSSVKPKAPHRFFDTTSTAYIEPVHLPNSINPFNFHIKVSLPPPPKPVTPQPVKPQPGGKNNNTPRPPDKTPPQESGKKPAPATPPQQAAKPQPQQTKPTPPKPQPPKVVRKISIQYRGYIRGTTDEQRAFYSALDSSSKKTESKSAKEGAKIHGVLPIKSFDADQLVVVQGGKDVIVKRGKKQEIIIP
ncbi:MAG: hypothetical protein IKR81_10275 [Victivallales bacterium]|nr:hypothetical protein [Victivallales bacterium]